MGESGLDKTIEKAEAYFGQGEYKKALVMYEEMLSANPGNALLLFRTGVMHAMLGNLTQAFHFLNFLKPDTEIVPDNIKLAYLLGIGYAECGMLEDARKCFEASVQLAPSHVDARLRFARVLFSLKRLDEALVELKEAIRLDPARYDIHTLLANTMQSLNMLAASNYHIQLAWHYAGNSPDKDSLPPRHTLFVDQENALQVARQGNVTKDPPLHTFGVQLCYYRGEAIPDAPPNLINVPLDDKEAEAFFCFSTWSLPTEIDFDPSVEAERIKADSLVSLLDRADSARKAELKRLAMLVAISRPEFVPGKPLRVYCMSSRHDINLAWNTRCMAREFRRLGCEVLHYTEFSDLEKFDPHHRLQAQITFKPHVVLDINRNFDFQSNFSIQPHADVFRIFWMQDPTHFLRNGISLPWRKRDLVYSLGKFLDSSLHQCGATEVGRGESCYDSDSYRDFGNPRKGVVFVGDSYHWIFRFQTDFRPMVASMEEMFVAGEPMTETVLDRFASQSPHPKEDILCFFWAYAMRSLSLPWLCELSKELDIDVEVYGTGWELNEAVSPFFKGPLPQGEAVAEVYNRAKYVFAPHPFDLKSQRLAEISACGAIPIAYDCRHRAEKPHWDNHCLWYRTKEDLRTCLNATPPESPSQICQDRSYAATAKRFLADIKSRLSDNR